METSKNLKKTLLDYLIWRLHYSVVIDEHNFMDIFGIRRNGFMVEFEIKVSKSDFVREINLLKCEQPNRNSKDWPKWEKHAYYLGLDIKKTEYELKLEKIYAEANMISKNVSSKFFIPNEFNFYVPDYLTEFALQKLEGLPYGLMQYGQKKVIHSDGIGSHSYFSPYEVIKKPTKLHSEKATTKLYMDIAHGLSARNRLIA